MNIRDLAYSIYSNRDWNHIGGPKDGPLYTMDREEYADYLAAESRKRWESGETQKKFLFNGSETRAQLSKTEIIALANKYNVRDMDDDSFDALLDDLESMGAISNMEKQALGYRGMQIAAYADQNGELVSVGTGSWTARAEEDGSAPIRYRREADGDVWRWLNDRMKWTPGENNVPAGQADIYETAHKVLGGIVSRMDQERPEGAAAPEQKASDSRREELLREIRDGKFFEETIAHILETAQKLEEEKKKQATIDALSEMLDNISGRNEDARDKDGETANGLQLGLSADQENTFQMGFMPLELQVYLRNLGVSGALDATEPDEEKKVEETEHAEGAEKPKPPEEIAAELAESYDPRHMSTEEFGNFMDALADSGAMSAEAAERIKNAGQWTITVRDEYGNVVEPLAWRENGGTPADPRLLPFLFGEHSLDGDVLAWARLGSANADFRDLADILSRMEEQRNAQISEII